MKWGETEEDGSESKISIIRVERRGQELREKRSGEESRTEEVMIEENITVQSKK